MAGVAQGRRVVSRSNPYGQRNDRGACTCSGCGRRFGSLSAFDAHRITTTGLHGFDSDYDWRCADEAELADRDLVQGRYGLWRRRSDPNVATQERAS